MNGSGRSDASAATPTRRTLRALAPVFAIALSACTVGPDFLRPKAPDVDAYTPAKLPDKTASAPGPAGAAQTFVSGRDLPYEWWTLFRSEPLNRLVSDALKVNPDVQAAEAALRQARETYYAEQGGLYPEVDGSLSAQRQRSAGALQGRTGTTTFNLYRASIDVSYGLDIFGGERRLIEARAAQAEFQEYQLEATYLTLSSNVVGLAIQEASLREQIAATEDIIGAQTDQLDVVRRQFELGAVSRSDVLAQEAAVSQTRATLPGLSKQLAQTRNQLTSLAGRFPSQNIEQTFRFGDLALPEELPLTLPSKLVEQRPDVRAREALLHAASAEIGVATANQLPQITLTGSVGTAATQFSDLFKSQSLIWSAGAGLAQSIFDGGRLDHEKKAAVAAFDQAAAQYRSTVLTSFQDVADALHALQNDADALAAQAEAERSAADSLALARDQFNAGAINYLTLLNAERTYQQSRISRVQAQASRYADTVALFQALGGGWWNRSDLASGQPSSPSTR
ncbi:MAG TPA: efflux transporter outer membrane subunit [Alphaproteobacteria bacterium]|jgi:NodT family efflux transporter outer membrane factor (OMF) lipoprotein|nr:efflux transporter outer membrane subunit [Alphaproteobacteria bacterium]